MKQIYVQAITLETVLKERVRVFTPISAKLLFFKKGNNFKPEN